MTSKHLKQPLPRLLSPQVKLAPQIYLLKKNKLKGSEFMEVDVEDLKKYIIENLRKLNGTGNANHL